MAPPTKRSHSSSNLPEHWAVRTICDPDNSNRELGQTPDFNEPMFWPAEMEGDENPELEVEEAEAFTDDEADFAALKINSLSNRSGRYIGNSSRTRGRKRAQNRNATLGSCRIETYFNL